MGKIGFIFEIEKELLENYKLTINNKQVKTPNIVIFKTIKSINGNYITGKKSFKKDNCAYFEIDKFGDLKKTLILNNSLFKFGKISLAQKTIIDFKYLTFWFNARKYRDLNEILTINQTNSNLNELIKTRTIELLEIFNLNKN